MEISSPISVIIPNHDLSQYSTNDFVLPFLILIGCVAVAGLHQQGYIDLPHFGSYEMPVEAKIGQQFGYDFSKELIPLLDPQGSNPGIYTFYLGSGVGFPPMGLILGIDGILKGVPTGKSSTFEVCVKDAGGRSACRKYHLTVNDKTPSNPPAKKCPATSCESTSGCCGSKGDCGEISCAVAAILVFDYCECPSDTVFAGKDTAIC